MFNNLFGKGNKKTAKIENKIPWISLTSIDQLEKITQNSEKRTQMIFKHSTTCGISRMVLKMFGKDFDFVENKVDLYYLNLHSYREVSNETGYRYQVMHQSPQLLIIKNGVVVAHDSHGAINDISLSQYA